MSQVVLKAPCLACPRPSSTVGNIIIYNANEYMSKIDKYADPEELLASDNSLMTLIKDALVDSDKLAELKAYLDTIKIVKDPESDEDLGFMTFTTNTEDYRYLQKRVLNSFIAMYNYINLMASEYVKHFKTWLLVKYDVKYDMSENFDSILHMFNNKFKRDLADQLVRLNENDTIYEFLDFAFDASDNNKNGGIFDIYFTTLIHFIGHEDKGFADNITVEASILEFGKKKYYMINFAIFDYLGNEPEDGIKKIVNLINAIDVMIANNANDVVVRDVLFGDAFEDTVELMLEVFKKIGTERLKNKILIQECI